MRLPALLPPLLLLAAVSARAPTQPPDNLTSTDASAEDDTYNGTIRDDANGTLSESDEHEPIVRKKRTFGDIVFRGLADALGYSVARKPAQTAFPPPLAPVPGIDTPLQAAPAPAPPCGAPRAAAPPPCKAQLPPPPPPPPRPPPCPKPRAAPRPKPKPKPAPPPLPPPPPPPPCGKPRANPTTPSPCAPPPPPPPKDNLETISSNFRLDFNFVRSTPAPAAAAESLEQQIALPVAPVALEPRAARLPLEAPREPRVFVDAFVVRNGVAQRVNTVDAKQLNSQSAPPEDDYLAYDDEEEVQHLDDDDDYEDVQESRDRAKAVKDFTVAVDNFWESKQRQKQPQRKQKQRTKPPADYRNVHFGDRNLVNQIRRSGSGESHQSLQHEQANSPNRIPLPLPEADEEDSEVTTTTEDPRRRLKPRVLPPTEQHPNQIDTVTVRVPPIYREKRPKKLHREKPDRDEEHSEETDSPESEYYHQESRERDADGEDSSLNPRTEKPVKRKRKRKHSRKTRSAEEEEDEYSAGDYDYFGKKIPISEEEQFYRGLTIAPPTQDADLARIEQGPEDKPSDFLDDHERLREDPEREGESERLDDAGRSDDSGKLEDFSKEKLGSIKEDKDRADEREREDERERADEGERTDKLSPNARVHETGYKNKYVRAHNYQVDDPRPSVATLHRNTHKNKLFKKL